MATQVIGKDNFKETVQGGGIILLDWWAEWCGPCRAFGPVFEKASETHQDVVFGKIDTEAQPELSSAFEIRSIPTLMVFRDGVLLFQQAGALPAAALEDVIQQAKDLDMEKVRKEIARPRGQARASRSPRTESWPSGAGSRAGAVCLDLGEGRTEKPRSPRTLEAEEAP